MNKIIHLSLARKSVPVLMDVVQGTTAPSIEFVLDDYTPPSNARARIYILKEGGEVYNNCTLSGNVVTYTPTAGSFDVPGQCVAQLELVQSSTVAVSWRIFVTVEPNLISGSSAPASTEFGALTSLIQSAQAYDGIIGANNITGYNNRQGWIDLTTGQDLDSITTPGVYSANTTVSQSLLNNPVANKGNFKMVVEHSISSSVYIRQTITLGGILYSGEVWTRQRSSASGSWSNWVQVPLRSEVNAIANRGGKNVAKNVRKTTTINGVTFTVNSDGSIVLNGTSTGTITFPINATSANTYYDLPSGTYTMTGGEDLANQTSETYDCYLGARTEGGTAKYCNYTNGGVVSVPCTGNMSLWIYCFANRTFNNFTIKPMLRDASIQGDTYVPYGMSNAELTEKVFAQSEAREVIISVGSVLSTDLPLGKFYVTDGLDLPDGINKAGYLDITARVGNADTVRRVTFQPYNAYDYYVNMLQNSTTWSGWRKFSGTAV